MGTDNHAPDAAECSTDCRELDGDFAAEEARRSRLLLEARGLQQQSQSEAAADLLAEAAEVEERLADAALARGLVEKSLVHRFSAASCWAQAGDFYRAIHLCQEILGRPDLPDRLRRRVSDYAAAMRGQRADWYARVAGAAAP